MTTAVPLRTSNSVSLDGAGDGSIRLAPSGEKWEINFTRVFCSTRGSEAQCRLYRNTIAPLSEVEGTYSGSSGDTSDTRIYLEDGEALHVVWTGGDPGAIATVNVTGWRSSPDGGFRAVH